MYTQIRLTQAGPLDGERWAWAIWEYDTSKGDYVLKHLPTKGRYAFVWTSPEAAFATALEYLRSK